MSSSKKQPPEFSRTFLIDLGGGGILYRSAEKLFESHAVDSAEWSNTTLTGLVNDNGEVYTPELDLRSTVFAKNKCQCPDGRKQKVCVHALAVALHYEALRLEIEADSAAFQTNNDRATESEERSEFIKKDQPKKERLRSIKIAENGTPLRILIFLPPNFESAVKSGGVVVKIDAAIGKEIRPLGKLSRDQPYRVANKQVEILKILESWCGGKLAGILQLKGDQLRLLLDKIVGEPIVYWVKKPSVPIVWEAGRLEGVSEHLPEPSSAPEAEKVVESNDEPKVALDTELRLNPNTSLRDRAKPNLRRMAESRQKKLFQSQRADYPVANAVADSMEKYSRDAIVIDGSTSYVVVRLPEQKNSQAQDLRTLLKSEGFRLEPGNKKWWLRDRHKTLNFLASHLRTLRERFSITFTDNFEEKLKGVSLSDLDIQTVNDGSGFSLSVTLSEAGDETDLRKAIASGRSYIENEPGKIVLLDKSSVDRLHELERAVSGQADRPFTPTFNKRLSNQDLADVEDLLDELVEGWQPPQAWQSRSGALKQVGALQPAPLRAEFDEILRTYQRIGVAWLWHLYRHELGGILADEMGLGKTLQALALIEVIRRERPENGPALVVCPASLVENWMREGNRFVSEMKILKHHGPKRSKDIEAIQRPDIIVTSYGTLRQDADLLSEIEWGVVIGDEAQHIKNRRSQNARSLIRLQCAGRFLLTGTPVENSLDDLLSLFSFLMPGYLQTPHGKLSSEDKAWHNQRQTARAAAYILRRTKKEVAPELPDKIEKTFFCEFSSKQQRFYQDTLEKTRRDIFNLEMSGANKGKVQFAAFTELLRLRQACVDPRILDDSYPEKDSAKLAAFDEILDECLDSGSRILVFSSFTTALSLLAEHLQAKGHSFCYLDGKTRDRLAVCDTFNNDPTIPVFLISLKAGGTGLNLTGADTVVHYDPWWNPAAEAQATDRAHRIGQKKVVTSIKLIAANTVEEKVLELQKRKAEILKELFEESENVNAKVSLDDIKDLLS